MAELLVGPGPQIELVQLLSRCFPVPPGGSFLDDFPVWDERHGQPIQRLALRNASGRLIAAAAMRLAELRNADRWARVALIGCVCSDPEHRGQGLATQLVADLLGRARTSGVEAALLFGAEHGIYEKLGFSPVGAQVQRRIGELALPEPRPDLRLQSGWSDALFPLVSSRGSGLKLMAEDLAWYRAHRNSDWFWVGDSSHPLAYVCIGRGIDLGGMIHEWGGSPEFLRELLAWLAIRAPDLVLLGNPSIAARFGIDVSSAPVEPMALIHKFDPAFSWARDTWLWGLDGA